MDFSALQDFIANYSNYNINKSSSFDGTASYNLTGAGNTGGVLGFTTNSSNPLAAGGPKNKATSASGTISEMVNGQGESLPITWDPATGKITGVNTAGLQGYTPDSGNKGFMGGQIFGAALGAMTGMPWLAALGTGAADVMQGQSVTDALKGAATSYVGSQVGAGANSAVGGGATGSVVGGAASGATSAGLSGGNILQGAVGGAVGGGIGAIGSAVGNNLGTAATYDTTPGSAQTNTLAAQDASVGGSGNALGNVVSGLGSKATSIGLGSLTSGLLNNSPTSGLTGATNTGTNNMATTDPNAVDPNALLTAATTPTGGTAGSLVNSTASNPLGILPQLVAGGAAVNAIANPPTPGYNTARDQATSPWYTGGGAQQASGQLQNLLSNPSSIFSDPAFQAANAASTNQVERTMSAQGMNLSGNMIAALGQQQNQNAYNFYNQQAQLLGSLAGSQFNPAGGVQAATNAGTANTNAKNTAVGNLVSAMGSGSQQTGTTNVLNQIAKLAGGGAATGATNNGLSLGGQTIDPNTGMPTTNSTIASDLTGASWTDPSTGISYDQFGMPMSSGSGNTASSDLLNSFMGGATSTPDTSVLPTSLDFKNV
jgi:hypothetical protein